MYARRAASISFGLILVGCGAVPPLAGDPITIKEIVQRVKCEIAIAIPKPQGKWPTGDYQWLRDWTAKVDLTLETDDTGGITPGISFVEPMRSVAVPGSGTFTQMFSFGLGGGISTTASRTETLSFTLSFAELGNGDYLGNCDLPRGLGLLGNLGLNEWMQAALAPTAGKEAELRIGYHAPPSSGAKAATPKKKGGAKPEFVENDLKRRIDELDSTLETISAYADEASSYSNSAQRTGRRLQSEDLTKPPEEFYRDVQSTVDNIARTQDAIDQANKEISKANTQVAALKERYPNDLQAIAEIAKAEGTIKKANDIMSGAKKAAVAAQGSLPTNGPIDSIAHQVSFVVTLSGNATPNWTLVRFKGPGTANNGAASASRAFTHTLNISMGSPSDSGIGKVSQEQLRQLDYLHQNAAFRNALTLQSAAGSSF